MKLEKKLEKLVKILGRDKANSLSDMTLDELKATIVNSEVAMAEVKNELEANPKYQELKESLKALSEGAKEVKKYQTAVIQYALLMMRENR